MCIRDRLQIGARDVAFPRLNALSYWVFLFGSLIMNAGWITGDAPNGGWFGYAPNSGVTFNPGLGMTYWVLGLNILGVASIAAGLNFVVTIINMRAPGMTLNRMPMFVWMTMITGFLIIFAFPVITIGLVLLLFDLYLGTNFFIPEGGGDPVLWQHLFWFFGHPEVYVVLLPAIGITADVMTVFARKKLFAYKTVLYTVIATGVLSFTVWAHHQFISGVDGRMAHVFTVTTLLISVPIAEMMFVYIATLYGGRISLTTPMLWALAFIAILIFPEF